MHDGTADVLIAGAGPAGCAVAMALQDLGTQVLVCAGQAQAACADWARIETIGPPAIALSERLSVGAPLFAATIGTVGRFLRDGKPATLDLAEEQSEAVHLHIDRGRLDTGLRALAASSGVRWASVKVTGVQCSPDAVHCRLDDGRIVLAHMLIDASGRGLATGRRNRKLLSPPLLASIGSIPAAGTGSSTDTFFTSRAWGWTWQIGRCGDRMHWTALAAADRKRPPAIERLVSRSIAGSVLHRSVTWQIDPGTDLRILQIGDASGSLDPASGLGLANAFATALAAEQTVRAVLSQTANAADRVSEFHDRRIAMLLSQADALSRRYASAGIMAADNDVSLALT